MTHKNPNAAGFKSNPRRSCVARTFWKFLLPCADTDDAEAHFRLLPTLGEEDDNTEDEEGTTAAQNDAAEDIA